MPPMVALSGPHPSAATMSGRGARLNSNSEISAPETIEANISAEAEPAAMAMRTVAIISCPAPFERLEVSRTPTIGDRTTRQPYEDFDWRHACRQSGSFLLGHDPIRKTGTHISGSCCLPDHVRQQAEKSRALDGARKFTLLLGGD